VLTPTNNYTAYREIESRKFTTFIPFFGLAMKDLIFTNDGNPKKLENGLYNFGKLRQLTDAVQRIMVRASSSSSSSSSSHSLVVTLLSFFADLSEQSL